MKRFKFFGIILLTLLIIIGECGCSISKVIDGLRNNNKESSADIVGDMRMHLSEKYGYIDYDIEGFIAAGWDHPYDRLNLSTKVDGIEEPFSVERHKSDDGYTFEDNYFGIIVRGEFEDKVKEYAEKYFSDFKVYAGLTSNNYPNSLTKESTLEDLMEVKSELDDITFFVLVKEEFGSTDVFNDVAKEFIEDWSGLGLESTPRVIYLSEEVYNSTDRTDYLDVLGDKKIAEYREMVN